MARSFVTESSLDLVNLDLTLNQRKFLLLWLLTWVLLCVTQYSPDSQVAVAPGVGAVRVRALM